jgi:hypothetical protein
MLLCYYNTVFSCRTPAPVGVGGVFLCRVFYGINMCCLALKKKKIQCGDKQTRVSHSVGLLQILEHRIHIHLHSPVEGSDFITFSRKL